MIEETEKQFTAEASIPSREFEELCQQMNQLVQSRLKRFKKEDLSKPAIRLDPHNQ